MSKQYDIFSLKDFENCVDKFRRYFDMRKQKGLPFQKIKIISKRWQKPKTSRAHRTYWRCVGEMKKAFIEIGYDVNEEEVHQFVKAKSGFTKVIKGQTVTRSIADKSDDATSKNLAFLIDFMIRFSAQELNYAIDIS